MNRKRALDTMSVLVWSAVWLVAWLYPEEIIWPDICLWGAAAIALLFLMLALHDRHDGPGRMAKRETAAAMDRELATELVLLSDEDTELTAWELYGKISMLIGRTTKDSQADVDLSRSSYASMVDAEHAALNFAGGAWYLDDLGSENGTSIQKAGDKRVYRLSRDASCRLERGDCIQIGLNRLLLR